ncbi:MAG: HAD-IIIA family hydrolase [Pseudomonadota bacterium]
MDRHILFDLDGTLVDTAPDLANSLNAVRQDNGLQDLPFSTIRPTVSLGGNAMIKLAFGLEEEDKGFAEVRQAFLQHYHDNIVNESNLFSDMEKVLQHINERKLQWGIVTNKNEWLTTPLVNEMGLAKRAACIVSGDTTEHRKPHPAPLLYACKQMHVQPEDVIYIGDAERDIEAGRRAGTKTLAALYGYIETDNDPASWQADGYVNSPIEIIDAITKLN